MARESGRGGWPGEALPIEAHTTVSPRTESPDPVSADAESPDLEGCDDLATGDGVVRCVALSQSAPGAGAGAEGDGSGDGSDSEPEVVWEARVGSAALLCLALHPSFRCVCGRRRRGRWGQPGWEQRDYGTHWRRTRGSAGRVGDGRTSFLLTVASPRNPHWRSCFSTPPLPPPPAPSSGLPLVAVGAMDGRVTVLHGPTGAVLAAVQAHAKYVVRVAWAAADAASPDCAATCTSATSGAATASDGGSTAASSPTAAEGPGAAGLAGAAGVQPLLLASGSTDETVSVHRLDLDLDQAAAAAATAAAAGGAGQELDESAAPRRQPRGGRVAGGGVDLASLQDVEAAGIGRLSLVKQVGGIGGVWVGAARSGTWQGHGSVTRLRLFGRGIAPASSPVPRPVCARLRITVYTLAPAPAQACTHTHAAHATQ